MNRQMPDTVSGGQNDVLRTVREIATLINASNDYEGLLDNIVRSVCRYLKWSRCSILVTDRAKGLSRLVTAYDTRDGKVDGSAASWDLASSPTLKVAETRRPLVLEDAQNDNRFPKFQEAAIRHALRTIVLLPLSSTDPKGREMVFTLSLREDQLCPEGDMDSLSTISDLVSIAVSKFKLFQAEQAANENLRHLLAGNSRLMQRIIGGCSMQEVAELAALQIRHPFAIYDRVSDSFLWSGHPEPIARTSEPEKAEAAEALAARLRQLWGRDVSRGWNAPLRVECGGKGALREVDVVLQPLMVSEQMLGGLAVFPKSAALNDFERLEIQGLQFAVSAHLMRTYSQWTQKTTAITAFFGHLFNGEWQSVDQIEAMADSLGIDFRSSAQLLAVDLGYSVNDGARLLRPVEKGAQQIFPAASVFLMNHVLFVYFPLPKQGADKAVRRLAQEIEKQVQWRSEQAVAMTISPVCKTPSDFKPARDRCLQVLRLSRLFRKTGLVRSDEFGSFAVLVSALGDEAMSHFLDETLAPIIEHDKSSKGALLQCAEAFLKQGCRYQAAADALGLHVSTLRYRLKRLAEVFGLDLEASEDDRFALSLALRIHQLRN